MRKRCLIGIFSVLFIVILFSGNNVNAQTTCYSNLKSYILYAGQDLDVGIITICHDDYNLYATYYTNNNWVIKKTHLSTASSLDGIPQTKKNNPKVGHFDFQEIHSSVNEYTYQINLSDAGYSAGDTIIVAAHAEVQQIDLDGNILSEESVWADGDSFSGNSWATFSTYEMKSTIAGPAGGTFEGEGGVTVMIPAGSINDYIPVNIEPIEEDDLEITIPPNFELLGAVKFDIDKVVLFDNADVSIPCPLGVPTDAEIYVAKVIEYAGSKMLMMIDTAVVQDDKIRSQDPAFPGILSSGTFIFLWGQNTGWVEGQVMRDTNGSYVPGAVVTLSGGYWLDITDDQGSYSLPGWTGNFVAVAFDPITGQHGEKQGYMPYDGASISMDLIIKENAGPVQSSLVNSDFEFGDLTGWVLTGEGSVVSSLGPINPIQGNFMAMISSGGNAVGDSSSALEQTFAVPTGASRLVISYNFVSEEYPEFVGSVYNDVFNATLHTPDGSKEIAFDSVNSATWKPVYGIDFPGGDNTCGETDWITEDIDVSQWAGTDDTLTLTVHDMGDTIYDTVVLLDQIEFIQYDLKLLHYHDASNKFVFSKKVVEQGTDFIRADLRLMSGAGCWYVVTPNYDQNGTPLNYAEVNYLAPYGNILIGEGTKFLKNNYLHLDLNRWDVGAYTMTAIDVILRGLFSKRLEDVLTNDKDQISLLIKIVKESGLVSPLDTGTAFLFNGEYLNAAKEYVKAFKQISELVGEDTMEKIFVSVCGQSGKIIWNTGITTLLQIISLPDKYYLLKEIADNYVTNPGPLDGYVRLEAQ